MNTCEHFVPNNLFTSPPRWWGYVGTFPGDFHLWKGDSWWNQLHFCASRGFHGSAVGASVLFDSSRIHQLERLQEEFGQSWAVHYGLDLCQPVEESLDSLLRDARRQNEISKSLNLPMAHAVVTGELNRFDREFPLVRQIETLRLLLDPLLATLGSAGITLCIENHVDYYVTDLANLCDSLPGLGILLDTGNCSLIGERLDQIPDAIFQHVTALHVKDHRVLINERELVLRLTGATLGDGDVGLDSFFQRLGCLHPAPDSVRAFVEWVCDPQKTVQTCFNDSLKFIRRIAGEHVNLQLLPL